MLYLIDTTMDLDAMSEAGVQEQLDREYEVGRKLYERGVIVRLWRKANGMGSVAVLNVDGNAGLDDVIRSLPLHRYFRDVVVTPLVVSPYYPEFGPEELADTEREAPA